LTGFSSTSLSGFVDTSAQWNLGTGNANPPPYKFGGPANSDGFNLNVVQLRIESRPSDEEDWAAGYRMDLWAGPDANTLGTQSALALGATDFAIRQAYVTLRVPFMNGIDVRAGVFDSIIGYESVEAVRNPNFTRSFGHTIEPQTHTGLLGTYHFSENAAVSFGAADTVGPAINGRANPAKAESYKTYMGSIRISAGENRGFLSGSTLYAGIVSGFSEKYSQNQSSYYIGGALKTPIERLRAGAAFDFLDVHSTRGETWSVTGYASYQATDKLSFHGRAEYLRDRGDQKFFVSNTTDVLGNFYAINPDRVLSVTATAQYDLWRNVISRVELRWDHSLSGQPAYGGQAGDTLSQGEGLLRNAWMLAANLIYKF
jgi:hypothetical protein